MTLTVRRIQNVVLQPAEHYQIGVSMEMKKTVQAKSLTRLQLRMLDIGAPVIVSCKTLTGETVNVRLQTENLEPAAKTKSGSRTKSTKANGGHAKGCWVTHGAYVAIMPNGEGK